MRKAASARAREPARDAWALDLGTTNSAVARWHAPSERAVLVMLPNLARTTEPAAGVPTSVIPSGTHFVDGDDLWSRLGDWPPFRRRYFWGRRAWIGQAAVDRNLTRIAPEYAPSFKPHLQAQPHLPIARLRGRGFSARDVARTYVRELFAEIWRTTGERVRELTVTVPVDAYETYRAELLAAFEPIGLSVQRFVDEPVAAAVGYGLSIREGRRVLVADMGGGTLDLALVEVDGRSVLGGRGRVVTKLGRPVGGDVVDRWVLDHLCDRLGTRAPADPFWYRLLLDEARSIKERLFLVDSEVFHLRPPRENSAGVAWAGADREVEISRTELMTLLEAQGLYKLLSELVDEVTASAAPEDVLLVGGSTLLPGIFPLFEQRFGRDRVRAWQPFDAVVTGACAFAARGFATSDYIVHDYALLLRDPVTGAERLAPILPAGTRFPTAPDLWRDHVFPTCPLGEPEKIFSLVVCEVGRASPGETSFGWDAAGRLHRLSDGSRLVVPLNAHDPTLGRLDPPHQPGDRRPRLDLAFGVDSERWLIATVIDLLTGRTLMDRKPIVRLL